MSEKKPTRVVIDMQVGASLEVPIVGERPRMEEVSSLLQAAAPWAHWTQAQVADELRAMAPQPFAALSRETQRLRELREEESAVVS